MNREVFTKDFLNFFVEKKVNKKEIIITDGDEAKYLYIIKEGEYDISLSKSINEIDLLIDNFCGKPVDHKSLTLGMRKVN